MTSCLKIETTACDQKLSDKSFLLVFNFTIIFFDQYICKPHAKMADILTI